MARYALLPHPDFPPRGVASVGVSIAVSCERSVVLYRVEGGEVRWPPRAAIERKDGLWQTTCFELFARMDDGDAYAEFNFSPSTQWAAYRFDTRRAGMRELATAPPRVERADAGVRATFDLPDAGQALHLNLTAVIEEIDGTKSYWALAHPEGAPDFHDPACFVLQLPPLR